MRISLPHTKLKELETRKAQVVRGKRIDVTLEGNVLTLPSGVYKPFPTLEEFHNDKSDVKIILGPYGSGKSTGVTCEIVMLAIKMPKCLDGVRRLKAMFVRNTYDELKSTTLEMWKEWCLTLGVPHTNMQPPVTFSHEFYDKDGPIHLEAVFLALNKLENIKKKLGSYNITVAYLNEAREMPALIVDFIGSRCGRYPALRTLPPGSKFWHGVLGDSNASSIRHWLPEREKTPITEYKDAEGKTCKIVTKIFHQPPGLLEDENGDFVINPKAENIENLPGGYDYYFKRLSAGRAFVHVYCQGKYGSLREGQRVHEKYNDDLHSTAKIDVEPNVPVIYGVDYGRIGPAILICQFVAGQLRCLKEICGNHIYIKDLAEEELIPWLNDNAPRIQENGPERILASGRDDCAQTDEGRLQLHSLGLDVRAARTNRIEPRLAAVNEMLGYIGSAGRPRILISREGCPMLREGFLGEYKLEERRIIGGNQYKETPVKTHPYSDIQDALQYVALEYSKLFDAPKQVVKSTYKRKSMWI